MSTPNQSNGRPQVPGEGEGVLAKLPRTRPQRATARRAAARRALGGNGAAELPPTRASAASDELPETPAGTRARRSPKAAGSPKPRATKPARAKPSATGARRRPKTSSGTLPPVPRQGFECEWDRASGPVRPPGGAELAASAVEAIGELAKAGLSGGERILKDVLGRLPIP